MALTPGDRIAHYEIISSLGSGGMGDVYRARDLRLGRGVAIKVLPERVGADADRLARFQREATALASLNHPNIAQVYGFEEMPGTRALIMELIDGSDLSHRVGTLSIAEVIAIASQIASALESSHAAGIVHRDLKPANIMVRADGSVRVLDFGLARIDTASASPTMTAAGTVLGTAAYMSPEQAAGRTVDKRTDIWSFGCVMFEMLCGHRAFRGDSVAETLAHVLQTEPDWTALSATTPPSLIRLVRKCLHKNPTKRLRDIGDAHFDLEEAASSGLPERGGTGTAISRREYVAWTVAGVSLLAAVSLISQASRPGESEEVTRLAITAPAGHSFGPTLVPFAAVSPDGRQIVFVAVPSDGGFPSLWVRALSDITARKIPGTERASTVFWSPDSRALAFVVDGRLLRTDLSGTPQLVARVSARSPGPISVEGGTWGTNDVILIGTSRTGILRIPVAGGDPVPVTTPTPEEVSHQFPVWLPDQKHFLFHTSNGTAQRGSIDGDPSARLMDAEGKIEFIPPDRILFVRNADLMSQAFDVNRNELIGSPVRVADDIRVANFGRASFFASPDSLIYYKRSPGLQIALEVVNPAGKAIHSLPLGQVRSFSLSPDHQSLAVHAHENNTVDGELWLVDVARGSVSRIGAGVSHADHAVWSPDGKRLAVSSRLGLSVVPVSGTGSQVLLDDSTATPSDWSKDGKWIVYHLAASSQTDADIWAIPAAGGAPQRIIQSSDDERGAVLSPDGRWLAYTSTESGRAEIYVQAFPPDGRKTPISVGGGSSARWDGSDLFYWGGDGRVMRTRLTIGAKGLTPSAPEPMLLVKPVSTTFALGSDRVPYAVLPGVGFIRAHAPSEQSEEPMTVVVNWRSLLR